MTKAPVPHGPSAVLVLGLLSGVLSGVVYLGISIPLVIFTVNAQQLEAARSTRLATNLVYKGVAAGVSIGAEDLPSLGVDWLVVKGLTADDGFSLGDAVGAEMALAACEAADNEGKKGLGSWVSYCRHTGDYTVAAGRHLDFAAGRNILYWTVLLSALVGIVTTLGQARLLRPLTDMTTALERVANGERGVRLQGVGLHELDLLVNSINEAAENVEARQDTITARVAVVQEMARLVAHEVRNPLQSLELLTTLIEHEEDALERADVAGSIRREVEALDQVVRRLLERGARGGALDLNRKPQSLAPLLEHLIKLKSPSAQRLGIQLSLGVTADRTVSIDVAMLGRSLENLVVNALQATATHGTRIHLSTYAENGYLCVVIDDDGPGVEPTLGDTVFEANITSKAGGHGLGLALTKAVLLAHDGSIEHAKSPLGGARFVARIPIHGRDNNA